jgi:hypothetical protein
LFFLLTKCVLAWLLESHLSGLSPSDFELQLPTSKVRDPKIEIFFSFPFFSFLLCQ